MSDYAGRIAVITGGGRGFGAAFGRALAERGAHAVLLDVDLEAAQSAAAAIVADGGQVSALACDVADEVQVGAVMAEIAARHGGIDVLINNAGLHSEAYNQPSATMGVAKIRRLFEVNMMGTVICTLAAREAMQGREGASIVNISSSAAYGNATAYGVSKLGVRGLTMMFARELAPEGIRVNAIAPGLIFTDTIRAELSPQNVAMVMGQQVLKREGEERDIVQAMLHLTSSDTAFVTGETLRVTGGFGLSI